MKEFFVFFEGEFFGNSIGSYALFLLIIFLGILFRKIISRLFNRIIFKLLKRYSGDVSLQQLHDLLHRPLSTFFFLIILFIAAQQISFPVEWEMAPRDKFGWNMIFYRGFTVLLYASFFWILIRFADFIGAVMLSKANQSENKYSVQLIPFLIDAIKLLIVVFGVMIVLSSVFKINVATLVAGLGIGGLAIALAAQETLANLLGSVTIFLDKPFKVGDMVTVGSITGKVEKIGFRSTRIRTLEKSYVTVPNKKMVDSELDNLTERTFRRANFTVGVTYSTSNAQLKAIVKDIQDYIDNHPNTNEDGRVRFEGFGPSSLDIMVMYFVDTMEWTTFLNIREEINYKIVEIVKEHGAEFAFPSTSIYIEKQAK
jgi:MscS family membrane protein